MSLAVLSLAYASLFLLEHALPLRQAKERLLPRVFVNVVVSAGAFAAAAAFVQPAAAATLDFTHAASFGLIPLIGLSGTLEIAAAFVLLDLSFYYWHVANHRIAFLWRFHNVHHIDPDLDVTTAFRFHFVEVGLSAGFRAAQVLLIGPSLAAYLIYELAFQLGTLFHHSNVRMPLSIERALNMVWVTPRMHGIHHSDIQDENLKNFGVVFSLWDRLHRTLRLNVAQAQVWIGIPGYSRAEDNAVLHVFVIPFRPQRDYWQGPQGRRLRRQPASSVKKWWLAD
ncbi:MAG: sterol desaturase [Betaproteobacteria bacterium 13_1_40CM_4_64_4]|nr:MAG: sterol desaturase [Betaproteobacteria bacterium 13_1_40CM_4_64_4]